MGASAVVSQLMIFIVVLGITTGLVVVLTNYVGQTGSAMNAKQKDLVDQLKTEIDIGSVSSNGSITVVYVKNIGDTNLKTSYFDLYVDGLWVSNFTILDPTTRSNVSVFTPQSTLLLNATHDVLSADTTHTAKVVTGNSVRDTYIFSF